MSAKRKPGPRNKVDATGAENKLSPERLALYKRTLQIREKIGPISSSVTDLIREMRGE
jgi:hypothetical protein